MMFKSLTVNMESGLQCGPRSSGTGCRHPRGESKTRGRPSHTRHTGQTGLRGHHTKCRHQARNIMCMHVLVYIYVQNFAIFYTVSQNVCLIAHELNDIV